jgi:ornithine decarboxylase
VPTPKLAAFLAQDHETPFLVVDLDVVAERFRRLAEALPGVRIFYAVKANPAAPVLRTLAALGSAFDVASPAEIDACSTPGPPPPTCRSATRSRRPATGDAHRRGITRFAVDSPRARQDPHPAPAPTCACASSTTAAVPTGRCRASSAAITTTPSSW